MFYIILNSEVDRQRLQKKLIDKNVNAVHHYVPLHSAPAGKKYSKVATTMRVTDAYSSRLLRLPLYAGLTIDTQQQVIDRIISVMKDF